MDTTVLSARERQIFDAIVSGTISGKALAERLHVSTKTIEHHKTRLYAKLNVRGVADLLHRALSERP